MLAEVFIGVLGNAVYGGGKSAIKRFFEESAVEQAVSATAYEFPNIPIVGDSLKKWIRSDAFAESLGKVLSGGKDTSSDEVLIDSFIKEGRFYDGLNNTHDSAQRVLESFAKQLEIALFRGKDGLLLEERRAQARHHETQAELQEIKAVVQEGRSKDADWARLESHTKENLLTIPDKIGNTVSLFRCSERALLDAAFQKANTVVMLGPSGCGKTVLAKSWIEEALGTIKALWFNARSFDIQDFSAFEGKYRLAHSLPEILLTISSNESRLVIDAIDRVFSDEGFRNISILMKGVEPDAATSPWRTLITCQPEEWDKIQLKLARVNISTSYWEVIHIKEPKLRDLDLVWQAFPSLSHLSRQLQLRSLLLKPKVLDLLATKLVLGGSVSTKNWVGESDLIEWFWETDVFKSPGAAMRSNFVKRLSEMQADELQSETPVDAFSTSDQEPLDGLLSDRICTLQEERLAFSHDLYGDWARQRILLAQSGNLHDYLQPRLGSPLWNRAVRLYGLHLLEKSSDVTQWRAVINALSSGEGSDLARDLLLESVIFAANPLPIYEKLWPELIADRGALLRRLLGRFLYVATLPNPMILAMAKELEPNAETQYAIIKRIPYWPYWLPMLKFLHGHLNEVLQVAPGPIAEIADTWLRQGLEDWPLRKEAAEIAITDAENIFRFKLESRYHIIKDKVDEVVYRAGLAGARELPDRVSAFALTACARKLPAIKGSKTQDQKDGFPAQSNTPPVFNRWRAVPLPPWSDGPRGRVDSAFQKLCLDGDALEPLILSNPQVAKEVLLASLIEDPEARNSLNRISDNLGADVFFDWFPPLYFRGPLLFFLKNRTEEGLDLILRFVNFITEVWSSRSTRPNQASIGVSIPFQDGERKWLGNSNVYYWYRDQPNCPDSVVVALMALEKWLYEELDAHHDVSPFIEMILKESNSLSFAGLLSAVGRKEPTLFRGPLLPLLGVSNFLIWEINDSVQPHDYLMIGWRDKDEMLRKVAHEWYTLPHRNINLQQMALWHFLNVPEMRTFFEQARAKWTEQFKSIPKRNKEFKDALESLIESFNIDNYKKETDIDHGERWVFVPPKKIRAKIEASRKSYDERVSIVTWPLQCRQLLNVGTLLREEGLESLWTELLRISESAPLKDKITGSVLQPEHAVCGAIAVLAQLHREWLRQHPEREKWCLQKLVEIIHNPPQPGPLDFEDASVDWKWNGFSAQAMPIFWAEDPDSPTLRKCIVLLTTNSNVRTVAYLFASVSNKRRGLGAHFRQLQHFLRRWAAEKWRHRFDQLRDKPKTDITKWLERECQYFIEGATAASVPTLRELAVVEPVENYRDPQDDWRRHAFAPTLDLSLIQAAYSWLPSLDQANSIEERGEWIIFWREALDCTLDRLRVENEGDEEKEIDGLPYEWDHWVFDRISGLILQLRQSEQPETFWKPILEIGPGGYHWLEDFLLRWFITGLGSENTIGIFAREWRAMAEFVFSSPKYNPQAWRLRHEVRRVWWSVLGFSQYIANLWDKDKTSLVTGMRDIYERWANSYLNDSMSALQFAAFLRSPAAKEIVLDGLVWFERNSNSAKDEFWREHNIQDILAEVLDNCWRHHRPQLRQREECFSAYKSLLKKLATFQNPLALEIQQRIVSLR
jgi:hypothetical protein